MQTEREHSPSLPRLGRNPFWIHGLALGANFRSNNSRSRFFNSISPGHAVGVGAGFSCLDFAIMVDGLRWF